MRFHLYNKEKKDRKNTEFYLKAAILGVVIAGVSIVSGLGLKFLIKLLIKYWMYAVAAVVGFILVKKFLGKKKHRRSEW